MKTHLQALRNEDPGVVFITRHINKLGFSSPELLRAYFERAYGEVKIVYVSHSRVKCMRPGPSWRLRAASLGFVVMKSAAATSKILEDGPEHVLNGVKVTVHEFHQQKVEGSVEVDEAEKAADEGADECARTKTSEQLKPEASTEGEEADEASGEHRTEADEDSGECEPEGEDIAEMRSLRSTSSQGMTSPTVYFPGAGTLEEDSSPYCGTIPLPHFLARFSEQDLNSAQPDAYED